MSEKTFEELAFDSVSDMTEDELEMALKEQDGELMKQLLSTIGEILKVVDRQGEVIEKMSDRLEITEDSIKSLTESTTKISAKVNMIVKAMSGKQ